MTNKIITTMKENELKEFFKECLDFWGVERQLRMAQEECGELIVAISHFLRNREDSLDELLEELADASLMIDEIIYEVGRHKISAIKAKKIEYVKNNLSAAKQEFIN